MTTKTAESIPIEFVVEKPNSLAKIAKVAPLIKGFKREIKFLWGTGESTYYRVNFHDPKDENKIKRSLFVKVTPMGASIDEQAS